MSDAAQGTPKRRLFDQRAGAPTLVGSGTRFEGRIQVRGPMSLGGTIVGDGLVEGLLAIAQDAHWQGNVRAQAAAVAGRVTGDLVVDTKLEIGRTAVIRGSVRDRRRRGRRGRDRGHGLAAGDPLRREARAGRRLTALSVRPAPPRPGGRSSSRAGCCRRIRSGRRAAWS